MEHGPGRPTSGTCRECSEYLTEQVRELRAMWHGSEAYWNGGAWDRMNEYEDRCLRLEQAWEEWHRACMEWLEKAQEMEVL